MHPRALLRLALASTLLAAAACDQPTRPDDAGAATPIALGFQIHASQADLLIGFVSIAADGRHSCGVTTGGDAFCWAHNQFDKLGDGTTERRLTPTAVVGWS